MTHCRAGHAYADRGRYANGRCVACHKAAQRRYVQSPKGRAALARAYAKYDVSDKGRARDARYNRTEGGRYRMGRYKATPGGQLVQLRSYVKGRITRIEERIAMLEAYLAHA